MDDLNTKNDLHELLSSNLFEIIPEACFVFNEDWYIIKMNSYAEQMFLLPKEYLMSKPFWEIAPQYVNTELYYTVLKVAKDKISVYKELKGLTSTRWFAVSAKNLGSYIIVFFRDISASMHAKAEFVRSEERFLAAFKKSPALMSILSLDNGEYISINDTFVKFTEYSPGEVIGKTKDQLNILCNNNDDNIKDQFLSNKPFKELSIVYRTKSNNCRHAVISSEQININGKPCLLNVGIDITDTVKYQKELENFERFNLVGQMSAAIAHEIRNPLQVVKGYLQLLRSKKEITTYSTQFDMMTGELERVNQIITEYLSLSRIKTSEFKFMNINQVINKILPLIEAQAMEENKKVIAQLGNIPKVWLDEGEIKQIVLNLVKNGLEAVEQQQCVKIQTQEDSQSVMLIISDQGNGIPVEVQGKIGSPFFTTKENGTGIGLAMSYGIAKRHHAKMEFVSNNKGTTFTIHFPINTKD